MKHVHKNCGGQVKNCPNNDETFCDHCGKWLAESDILESRQTEIVSICSNLNQGGSKMKHSEQLNRFIDSIVYEHARFVPYEGYKINYSQIPEDAFEEAAALLVAQDDDWAHEATCADNPDFDSKMLPALISHLRNPLDKDEQIEFQAAWRKGVTEYCRNHIESLIANSLSEFAHDEVA